ncbi:hypothetical protein B0H63DRAFT_524699 [Podospora didyma]|uniref:Uncharacterized protein n=1 Tax=Podospora didyma TaxID=330526 RepID=A0AAE0NI80_9PEZI|nr:hypothetical protein B0H63DRAFT_524699 [Podospora didyma]
MANDGNEPEQPLPRLFEQDNSLPVGIHYSSPSTLPFNMDDNAGNLDQPQAPYNASPHYQDPLHAVWSNIIRNTVRPEVPLLVHARPADQPPIALEPRFPSDPFMSRYATAIRKYEARQKMEAETSHVNWHGIAVQDWEARREMLAEVSPVNAQPVHEQDPDHSQPEDNWPGMVDHAFAEPGLPDQSLFGQSIANPGLGVVAELGATEQEWLEWRQPPQVTEEEFDSLMNQDSVVNDDRGDVAAAAAAAAADPNMDEDEVDLVWWPPQYTDEELFRMVSESIQAQMRGGGSGVVAQRGSDVESSHSMSSSRTARSHDHDDDSPRPAVQPSRPLAPTLPRPPPPPPPPSPASQSSPSSSFDISIRPDFSLNPQVNYSFIPCPFPTLPPRPQPVEESKQQHSSATAAKCAIGHTTIHHDVALSSQNYNPHYCSGLDGKTYQQWHKDVNHTDEAAKHLHQRRIRKMVLLARENQEAVA